MFQVIFTLLAVVGAAVHLAFSVRTNTKSEWGSQGINREWKRLSGGRSPTHRHIDRHHLGITPSEKGLITEVIVSAHSL